MREVDVLVVGGRVAGATVAALLADAGLRVLVVDRASFPSSTLSTHFFRGGHAVSVLERLGVLDEVLALGPPPLVCEYFSAGSVSAVNPPQEPGEIGYSLSVRREQLDAVLQRRALAAGAEIAERTRLDTLILDDGRVAGAHLSGAADGSVRARFVVGADGRRSRVAALVEPETMRTDPGVRTLYYRYVTGFRGPNGDPDGAEFSFLGNELAYVFPSDGGATCVALSLPAADFAALRADPQRAFDERLARHESIAAREHAASGDGRTLGAGPEASYVRVPHGPGWALVGDAGLHQDPWTGRGIDMATVHATFLAEALVEVIAGEVDEAAGLARYAARRDEHALEAYAATVALAPDLRQIFAE